MISGDRLIDIDNMRLDIVQKVFPAFGEAARPIDLFERERPEIFALPVKTPFEEWMVVALFNFETGGAVEKSVSLSRLDLDPRQKLLAFEFWQQRLLGEVHGELRMLVPPASVGLIALRKNRGTPQIIATDRHFTQGGVELRNVSWNAESKTLEAVSLGGLGTRHTVMVHIPTGFVLGPSHTSAYALEPDAPELPHDFEGYSVTSLPNGLARIAINFEKHAEVPWRLAFEK